jgi:hypothetical protein
MAGETVRNHDRGCLPGSLAGGAAVTAFEERVMSLGTIVLIIVILMVIGVVPVWPHSRSWGYAPSGGLGLVLAVLLILFLLGKI